MEILFLLLIVCVFAKPASKYGRQGNVFHKEPPTTPKHMVEPPPSAVPRTRVEGFKAD